MVITASLVLITVGYNTEQIAPSFGLFGTIIGYMLGRMSPSRSGASGEAGSVDNLEAPVLRRGELRSRTYDASNERPAGGSEEVPERRVDVQSNDAQKASSRPVDSAAS